jgi:hypothetical protein
MLFLRTDEEVGVSKKNTHKNNIKKIIGLYMAILLFSCHNIFVCIKVSKFYIQISWYISIITTTCIFLQAFSEKKLAIGKILLFFSQTILFIITTKG